MSSVPCGMGNAETASIPQPSTVEAYIPDRSKVKLSEQLSCEADGLGSVSGSDRHCSLVGSHATLPSPIRGWLRRNADLPAKTFRTSNVLTI